MCNDYAYVESISIMMAIDGCHMFFVSKFNCKVLCFMSSLNRYRA